MDIPGWVREHKGVAIGGGVGIGGFVLYAVLRGRRGAGSTVAPILPLPVTPTLGVGTGGVGGTGGDGGGSVPPSTGTTGNTGDIGSSPLSPVSSSPHTLQDFLQAPAFNGAGTVVKTYGGSSGTPYTAIVAGNNPHPPGSISTLTPEQQAGLSYTVTDNNAGTGPVVPLKDRVAGERYDSQGRVIQ